MEVIVMEAEAYKNLMNRFSAMEDFMQKLTDQLESHKKPYVSVNEVCEITGFGKTWVNDHKADIGYRVVGGAIRFKRSDVISFMDALSFKNKIRKAITWK